MNVTTKKTLSVLVALTGALSCAAFVGCSSSNTTNDVATGDDDSGTGTTGIGTTTTTDDAGVTTTTTTTGTGFVALDQTLAGTAYSYTANAAFIPAGTTVTTSADDNCTTTTVNSSCTYVSCAGATASDAGTTTVTTADAAAVTYPNAGDITITGGSIATAGLVLVPSATTGDYTALTGTGQQFNGGSSIVFSAAGDLNSIGSFSSTVTAPSDITLTAPTFTTSKASFPRDADLAVTWTGGTTGTFVTVTAIAETLATGASSQLSCKFDAAGGSGTLPTSGGLANFPMADGTTVFGSLSIVPVSATTAMATSNDTTAGTSSYTIEAEVTATATSGTFTTTN